MKFKKYSLSVLSGVLIFLSFPRFNLESLIWFSLVPLIYATENDSPKNAFILGLITGFVCYCGIIYWLVETMSRYGNLPIIISMIVLIFLVFYLSIYIGAFAFIKRYIEDRIKINSIFLAPVIWVSLEYLRSISLFGFPWASLGYSQYLNIPLIQISELTSVYGVSFLIIFLNIIIFKILKGYLKRWEGVFGIFIFISILIYGSIRIEDINNSMKNDKSIKVGILQGNIEQSIKWDEIYKERVFNIYRDLTIKAINKKAQMIIWPEASLPDYFQYSEEHSSIIRKLAKWGRVFILLGSPSYDIKDNSIKYYNSAFFIGPDGNTIGKYNKIHLVPFGEYVPFSKILTFVNKMVEGIGDFSSGEEVKNLNIRNISYGVLICFEVIFPDLTRRFVKEGAMFLVNITNDAWFGKTNAPYQHLSMITFRAIENRVWIARAANTGISAIIDPAGRIIYNTDIFKRDYFIKEVGIRKEKTFYTEYGDIFSRSILIIFIILVIFSLIRRKNERENKRIKIENF